MANFTFNVNGTIADNAVGNEELADMAEARFKMRAAGAGSGDPIDGTPDQATTALKLATDPFARMSELPAGGGDVVGPASSTDNNVPQWDGTTGKLLKDGLATSIGANGAADSGKIALFTSTGGLQGGEIIGGTGVHGFGDPAVQGNSNTGTALYGNVVGAGGNPLRLSHVGGSGDFIKCWAGGADNVMVVGQGGELSWPIGTGAQDTATNLPVFGDATKGVVPASGGGTSRFLRADATFASAVQDGDTLSTGLTFNTGGLKLRDTVGNNSLTVQPSVDMTGDRTLGLNVDADVSLQITGNVTLNAGSLTGVNTGDQNSIVGITGTIAQFNTACTDADFATGGGTATGTNTGDQTLGSLGAEASANTQRVALAANFTTNSATFVDVTGLAVTIPAGETWYVQIDGAYQSTNAATGVGISLTRTGSPIRSNFERRVYTAVTTAAVHGAIGNVDDAGPFNTTVDTINADRHWVMTGIVKADASPCVIQVRAGRGGSANNISIMAGSSIIAHRIS